jgi:hypothetical protein
MLLGSAIEGAIGLYVLVAAGTGLPTINIEKNCRETVKYIVAIFGKDTAVTVESCVRSEQEARQTILKSWAKYPAPDKRLCVNTADYNASYVQWLTCLEMEAFVRVSRRPTPKGKTE